MSALSNLRRMGQVARAAVHHGGAAVSHHRWPGLARRCRIEPIEGPQRLRMALEEAGGTFLKFGQILALQPDILPLRYCDALFKLLDRIEPFPYEEVQRIFTEEVGQPPEEIFDEIDTHPLATASVGQVHRAILDGHQVVVKVRRPEVETDFANDLKLMKGTIRLVRGLRLRSLNWMIEPMSEFVHWTQEEIDFRHEARYAERLAKVARDSATQEVPAIVTRLTTRRTLVMDFLDGPTLVAYLEARQSGNTVLLKRLRRSGFDPDRFAANVIDNFLGNAFFFGAYHADLHPANLLILSNNVVGYIDFGITGVLNPHSRRHLIIMTRALANGDMEALADHFLEVSVIGPKADVAHFRQHLEELSPKWFKGEPGDRSLDVSITVVMTEMLHLSRKTDILPERDIIKYIRSAIALDGLISRFAPSFDLSTHLEASCARYLGWFGRQQRYSPVRLLEWSALGERLLEEGPRRAVELLDRANAPRPAPAPAGDDPRRRRALALSSAILAVTLLLVALDEPLRLGLNLVTAQLSFLFGAGILLIRSLRSTTP